MSDNVLPGDPAPWFAFAGRLWLQPEAVLLPGLIQGIRDAGPPDEEWGDLLEAAEQAIPDDPGEIEKEYVRLFLSPSGAPCPPWQSVYEDPPQLMGAAHESALAWYRQAGFEPQAANEPADHAGLLLLFYSRLLTEAPDEEAAAERVEQFRARHLLWIPAWCASVEAESRLPFFGALARLTRGLLG